MSILTVKNLNHGFGDRAIFEDVSFRLLKGEHVGFIGANGEGKSTFMNIITRKLQPNEGQIEWNPRVRTGFLDQHAVLRAGMSIRGILREAFSHLFEMEAEIIAIGERMAEASTEELDKLMHEMGTLQELLEQHDFYVIDAKIEETAAGLGLMEVGLDRDVADLSGGQRTKVLLCKLLLEKPEILLLDEPTNYLDEEHIEWLKRYLKEYENAFILISHDIPFLNDVINIIYHVNNRRIDRYVGDYNFFLETHEAKKRQTEAAYERQQQELSRLEDFVARNKARAATAGMARSRQKKIDKMERIELAKEKIKPVFSFQQAKAAEKLIFGTRQLVIGYELPLTKPLDLLMERGQRIALVGANGLGKTTLLKSLTGLIPPVEGTIDHGGGREIGYFEQEEMRENMNTALEEFWESFPSATQQEVRSALAKCGLTSKQIESKVSVLSGGEKAKLRLAKIMNRPTNVLILDEPTNHLDPVAKDELKRALIAYKGSILLVSHEPEFYRDIVNTIWNCENWTLKVV